MPEGDLYKRILDDLSDGVCMTDRDRRIRYWNRAAEALTGYEADEVLGSRCQDDLLIHVDSAGRPLSLGDCPLFAAIEDGATRSVELFLHHKAGHRVPVTVRVTPLRDDHGTITGAVERFTDNSNSVAALERIHQLEHMAYIDALTGLANRRYLQTHLNSRLDEMARYDWTFGVVFLDIDNFKEVNDTFGHATGDQVIRMVAQTVSLNCRSFDVVGRWGGEELLAVLAGLETSSLVAIATRLRALVENSSIVVPSGRLSVTISAGATLAQRGDTIESLLGRADRLMYESKKLGRNRLTTDAAATVEAAGPRL